MEKIYGHYNLLPPTHRNMYTENRRQTNYKHQYLFEDKQKRMSIIIKNQKNLPVKQRKKCKLHEIQECNVGISFMRE